MKYLVLVALVATTALVGGMYYFSLQQVRWAFTTGYNRALEHDLKCVYEVVYGDEYKNDNDDLQHDLYKSLKNCMEEGV